jgi:hypothetical protein
VTGILRLTQLTDPHFYGGIDKDFDYLGYRFGPGGVTMLAAPTVARFPQDHYGYRLWASSGLDKGGHPFD